MTPTGSTNDGPNGPDDAGSKLPSVVGGLDPSPSAAGVRPESPAAATRRFPAPPPIKPETGPTPGQWGMIAFLVSEVAFFSTLIVTYIVFYGRDSQPGGSGGPTPAEVFSLPLVIGTTLCLVSSSVTIHLAERSLHHGTSLFLQLWGATIGLGVVFLLGTMHEWWGLIYDHGLTISRNLFGSTYYTLVGFHAFHVTVGVIVMSIVFGLAIRGVVGNKKQTIQLVSWYWHFVDVVWLIVFTLVYLVPRAA
jgi:cytochrome c oxidase subunit III